jgi:hypothetical protein
MAKKHGGLYNALSSLLTEHSAFTAQRVQHCWQATLFCGTLLECVSPWTYLSVLYRFCAEIYHSEWRKDSAELLAEYLQGPCRCDKGLPWPTV